MNSLIKPEHNGLLCFDLRLGFEDLDNSLYTPKA